jgi:hypothetical protein
MSTNALRAESTKVRPIVNPSNLAMEKGLPCNLDAERFVLGAVLLDSSRFPEVAALHPNDFSLERHGRIFAAIHDLHLLGENIDYVTVSENLARRNEFGTDGVSFVVSLTDGMPRIPHLDAYVRLVQKKAKLRRGVFIAQKLATECLLETAAPDEIFARHLAEIEEVTQSGGDAGLAIADIPPIRECGNHAIEYLRDPELPKGTVVALTGDSGSGKSTLAMAWAGEISLNGTPVLVLDRENPKPVMAERLERLGITDGPMLRIWGGWLDSEAPQPGHPSVLHWVKQSEPKPLVLVDSLVAFHGGDENDAGEMRAFMQQCRTLADLGATVVVIHHDGKADTAKDYRGSSDFKAAVDAAFHVSNFGADGRLGMIRLECFKSRFGFGGELVYHYVDGRFVRGRPGEGASNTTERLTELLRVNPGMHRVAFEQEAIKRGLGRKPARKFLDGGVRAGRIRCDRQGNARLYSLLDVEPTPE